MSRDVGLWTSWDPNGQKKDGKREDEVSVRYKEDGTEDSRWTFKDGETQEDAD